jgi:hypothetical protein
VQGKTSAFDIEEYIQRVKPFHGHVAPDVVIAGVEQDILPHKKSADKDEDIEEERRLFYCGPA